MLVFGIVALFVVFLGFCAVAGWCLSGMFDG